MGGDKKPSHEYFQSGHGKTVLAEAFLSDEQIRRVLRTTSEDLEALSWAGTHGSVASGMQSVAFTPASAIAAVFAATGPGPRHGRDELDGARHRPAGRGRPAGDDPLRRARGRHGRRRHDAAVGARLARVDRLRRAAARSTASRRSSPQRRSASRSARRPRWRRRAARTSSRPTTNAAALQVIALVFRYEVRDPDAFEEAYGPDGEWAQFFRQGDGYIGTELLHDVEEPGRYLVIDRVGVGRRLQRVPRRAPGASTCAAATRRGFHYVQELRFGTFENVWHARSRRTMTPRAGGAATTRPACACRCRPRRA